MLRLPLLHKQHFRNIYKHLSAGNYWKSRQKKKKIKHRKTEWHTRGNLSASGFADATREECESPLRELLKHVKIVDDNLRIGPADRTIIREDLATAISGNNKPLTGRLVCYNTTMYNCILFMCGITYHDEQKKKKLKMSFTPFDQCAVCVQHNCSAGNTQHYTPRVNHQS